MGRKYSRENMERREARLAEAEAPLLDEFRRIGIDVESVWDIPRDETIPPASFDLIIRALEHTPRHPQVMRLGLANALANRSASDQLDRVLALLARENDGLVRDALAGAASEMASPHQAARLLEACADESLGACRAMFVPRLVRFRRDYIRQALHDLAKDPALKHEIAKRLPEVKN